MASSEAVTLKEETERFKSLSLSDIREKVRCIKTVRETSKGQIILIEPIGLNNTPKKQRRTSKQKKAKTPSNKDNPCAETDKATKGDVERKESGHVPSDKTKKAHISRDGENSRDKGSTKSDSGSSGEKTICCRKNQTNQNLSEKSPRPNPCGNGKGPRIKVRSSSASSAPRSKSCEIRDNLKSLFALKNRTIPKVSKNVENPSQDGSENNEDSPSKMTRMVSPLEGLYPAERLQYGLRFGRYSIEELMGRTEQGSHESVDDNNTDPEQQKNWDFLNQTTKIDEMYKSLNSEPKKEEKPAEPKKKKKSETNEKNETSNVRKELTPPREPTTMNTNEEIERREPEPIVVVTEQNIVDDVDIGLFLEKVLGRPVKIIETRKINHITTDTVHKSWYILKDMKPENQALNFLRLALEEPNNNEREVNGGSSTELTRELILLSANNQTTVVTFNFEVNNNSPQSPTTQQVADAEYYDWMNSNNTNDGNMEENRQTLTSVMNSDDDSINEIQISGTGRRDSISTIEIDNNSNSLNSTTMTLRACEPTEPAEPVENVNDNEVYSVFDEGAGNLFGEEDGQGFDGDGDRLFGDEDGSAYYEDAGNLFGEEDGPKLFAEGENLFEEEDGPKLFEETGDLFEEEDGPKLFVGPDLFEEEDGPKIQSVMGNVTDAEFGPEFNEEAGNLNENDGDEENWRSDGEEEDEPQIRGTIGSILARRIGPGFNEDSRDLNYAIFNEDAQSLDGYESNQESFRPNRLEGPAKNRKKRRLNPMKKRKKKRKPGPAKRKGLTRKTQTNIRVKRKRTVKAKPPVKRIYQTRYRVRAEKVLSNSLNYSDNSADEMESGDRDKRQRKRPFKCKTEVQKLREGLGLMYETIKRSKKPRIHSPDAETDSNSLDLPMRSGRKRSINPQDDNQAADVERKRARKSPQETKNLSSKSRKCNNEQRSPETDSPNSERDEQQPATEERSTRPRSVNENQNSCVGRRARKTPYNLRAFRRTYHLRVRKTPYNLRTIRTGLRKSDFLKKPTDTKRDTAGESERDDEDSDDEQSKAGTDSENEDQDSDDEQSRGGTDSENEDPDPDGEQSRAGTDSENEDPDSDAGQRRTERESENEDKNSDGGKERAATESENEDQDSDAEQERAERESENEDQDSDAEQSRAGTESENEDQNSDAEQERPATESENEDQDSDAEQERAATQSKNKDQDSDAEKERPATESENEDQDSDAEQERAATESENEDQDSDAEQERAATESENEDQDSDAEQSRAGTESENEDQDSDAEERTTKTACCTLSVGTTSNIGKKSPRNKAGKKMSEPHKTGRTSSAEDANISQRPNLNPKVVLNKLNLGTFYPDEVKLIARDIQHREKNGMQSEQQAKGHKKSQYKKQKKKDGGRLVQEHRLLLYKGEVPNEKHNELQNGEQDEEAGSAERTKSFLERNVRKSKRLKCRPPNRGYVGKKLKQACSRIGLPPSFTTAQRKQNKSNNEEMREKHLNNKKKRVPVRKETVTDSEDIQWLKSFSLLNYAFRKSQKLYRCVLCSKVTGYITSHFKIIHQESEVLISRLSRKEASDAVDDAIAEGIAHEVENNSGQTRPQFCVYTCRMCDIRQMTTFRDFLEHVTAHTGEYNLTSTSTSSRSALTVENFLNSVEYGPLYGFICSRCNYVQVFRKNVEDHIERQHKEDGNISIIKINLSSKESSEQTNDFEQYRRTTPEREISPERQQQNEDGGAEVENNGAEVENNGAEVENYGAEVENYGAEVEYYGAEVENYGAEVEYYGAEVEYYGAEVENNGEGVENNGEGVENNGAEVENNGEGVENNGEEVGNGERVEEESYGPKSPSPEPNGETFGLETNEERAVHDENPELINIADLPNSPQLVELDADEEPKVDDYVEVKVELEIGPFERRKWVVGLLKAQILDDSDFLYDCLVKTCMFTTRVYSNFESHIRIMHKNTLWRGNCDACIYKPTPGENLTLLNALEHLTSHTRGRRSRNMGPIHDDALPTSEIDSHEQQPLEEDSNGKSGQNHKASCFYAHECGPELCRHCIRGFCDERCFVIRQPPHGVKTYFCNFCTFKSPLKNYIAKHVFSRHSEILENTLLEEKVTPNLDNSRNASNPVDNYQYPPDPYHTNPNPNHDLPVLQQFAVANHAVTAPHTITFNIIQELPIQHDGVHDFLIPLIPADSFPEPITTQTIPSYSDKEPLDLSVDGYKNRETVAPYPVIPEQIYFEPVAYFTTNASEVDGEWESRMEEDGDGT